MLLVSAEICVFEGRALLCGKICVTSVKRIIEATRRGKKAVTCEQEEYKSVLLWSWCNWITLGGKQVRQFIFPPKQRRVCLLCCRIWWAHSWFSYITGHHGDLWGWWGCICQIDSQVTLNGFFDNVVKTHRDWPPPQGLYRIPSSPHMSCWMCVACLITETRRKQTHIFIFMHKPL